MHVIGQNNPSENFNRAVAHYMAHGRAQNIKVIQQDRRPALRKTDGEEDVGGRGGRAAGIWLTADSAPQGFTNLKYTPL